MTMSRLFTIISYLKLGPAIGAIIVTLATNLFALKDGDFQLSGFLLIIVFLPFGYVVGAIPALITGYLMSFFEIEKYTYKLLMLSFLTGFAPTFICSLIFILTRSQPFNFPEHIFISCIAGLFSGVTSIFVAKLISGNNNGV
mgnify:FL=1